MWLSSNSADQRSHSISNTAALLPPSYAWRRISSAAGGGEPARASRSEMVTSAVKTRRRAPENTHHHGQKAQPCARLQMISSRAQGEVGVTSPSPSVKIVVRSRTGPIETHCLRRVETGCPAQKDQRKPHHHRPRPHHQRKISDMGP